MAISKAYKLGRCPKCGKTKKECKCINAPSPKDITKQPSGNLRNELRKGTKFKQMVVKSKYGWTEWVYPKSKSYLFKCCDCDLVHELQFKTFVEKDKKHGVFEVVSLPEQIRAMFRARRFRSPKH